MKEQYFTKTEDFEFKNFMEKHNIWLKEMLFRFVRYFQNDVTFYNDTNSIMIICMIIHFFFLIYYLFSL